MTTATSSDGTATGAAPPRGLGLALVAIVGAEFMLQIDGTIVNVALPTAQADLGLSVTAASWVLNGFFLAFGGLLLLAGRLGDLLGHRRLFLIGIGLVTVASLLAGLAPNVGLLLTGRVLQGAGAALAGPTGLALLTIVFEGDRQQRAFGLYSTITGLGAATGMILGGVLTGLGSWRWSLLVNVPIGLIIFLIALRTVGTRADDTRGRALGLPSAVLVTGALTAAVYGLVRAADHGWGYIWTIVPLVIAVVLVAALLAVDGRAQEPLLPHRIFTNRARLGGFLNLLLLSFVLGGFVFYLSQYLQDALHYGALRTGVAILPFGLALLVSTQVLTRFVGKLSLKARGIIGLVLLILGVAWLIRLDGHSGYAGGVLPSLIVMGLGVGLAIIPFNMIILSSSAPEDTGITAGILQAALTVGGCVGLAVLLIPFNAGGRPVADTIGTVFLWATAASVVGLVVALLFWFGPGSRDRGRAEPAGGAGDDQPADVTEATA
jgi:EmrB/QacA subfamily drug resistance transporter